MGLHHRRDISLCNRDLARYWERTAPKDNSPKDLSRGQVRLAAEIAIHLIRGTTIMASQVAMFDKAKFQALETLHRLARG